MRKKLIAANWKMHGSFALVDALVNGLTQSDLPNGVEVCLFPPFPYLSVLANRLTKSAISFGAQNVSEYESGAYTGEVSASMLKEMGCHYVLMGHSERRQYYADTLERVSEKARRVLQHGMIPLICIGETQTQRESGEMERVIKQQLAPLLDDAAIRDRMVIAYEPIWAIGTGLTASPEQAQAAHRFIRACVASLDHNRAETLQILYGGSVKADNARGLLEMPDIDGALVGGASLDVKAFWEIITCIN